MGKKVLTREEYYTQHLLCPRCKSDNVFASNIVLTTSEAKDYADKLNTARCENCGWRGMRNDLTKNENG